VPSAVRGLYPRHKEGPNGRSTQALNARLFLFLLVTLLVSSVLRADVTGSIQVSCATGRRVRLQAYASQSRTRKLISGRNQLGQRWLLSPPGFAGRNLQAQRDWHQISAIQYHRYRSQGERPASNRHHPASCSVQQEISVVPTRCKWKRKARSWVT